MEYEYFSFTFLGEGDFKNDVKSVDHGWNNIFSAIL